MAISMAHGLVEHSKTVVPDPRQFEKLNSPVDALHRVLLGLVEVMTVSEQPGQNLIIGFRPFFVVRSGADRR